MIRPVGHNRNTITTLCTFQLLMISSPGKLAAGTLLRRRTRRNNHTPPVIDDAKARPCVYFSRARAHYVAVTDLPKAMWSGVVYS